MKKEQGKDKRASGARAGRGAYPAWLWPGLIALGVLIFYWVPLTSGSASIQWDAADLHYPLQKYFGDRLFSGHLPFWTPYTFSGYPLLANIEVGAWYPPNWLFFLAGITPRAIEAELALAAGIACIGAYLFLRRLALDEGAAAAGALTYGFSGFFAAHSSHVGMFCAASLFPWLLLAYRKAAEGPAVRFTALGGLAGGMMLLAGHFQTALYGLLGMGLYALSDIRADRRRCRRTVAIVAGIGLGSVALAAIEIFPGMELTAHSLRAAADYSQNTEGVLHAEPLLTLVAPNWLGALDGSYRGPSDITQYYFYGGLLLLPLAIVGLVKSRLRIPALCILVPAVWYMTGPAGGFYRIAMAIPWLGKVRAPIHGWFVAAMGLAILAGAGSAWVLNRWRHPAVCFGLVLIVFADLFYWNALANPLAWARGSYEELYGATETLVRQRVAGTQPPLTRFDAPKSFPSLGPLDGPLNLRLAATYGYFALESAVYGQYIDAMRRNPRLSDGLNVSRRLNPQTGALEPNPGVLPRAYFPKRVVRVADDASSRKALETLAPAEFSTVLGPDLALRQDPQAAASVVRHEEQSYVLHYRAATPSLLKLSEAWYPGWRATAGGKELPVLRVDHALIGVVVPAGEGDITFAFHSNYFNYGAALSIAAALALAAVARRSKVSLSLAHSPNSAAAGRLSQSLRSRVTTQKVPASRVGIESGPGNSKL